MRLFLAVYPPPPAVDHLTTFRATLGVVRAGVRVAPPDQWHVTLAFLGEVPEERVDAARDAIAAGAEVVRSAAAPISLRVAGGGRFGRSRFTVVWAGLDGDTDLLGGAAEVLRRHLHRAGLSFDARPLKPHLTLARPGDKVPAPTVRDDLALLAGYEGPQWSVNEVRLVRSHLGPKPSYETIHQAPLR